MRRRLDRLVRRIVSTWWLFAVTMLFVTSGIVFTATVLVCDESAEVVVVVMVASGMISSLMAARLIEARSERKAWMRWLSQNSRSPREDG